MPPKTSTPLTSRRARDLRLHQSESEAKLWTYLRANRLSNVHFRRQQPIGTYIVDFCASRHKLIIELDGSQHLRQESYDEKRSAFLASKGYRVLRFWNHEVANNLEEVLAVIERTLYECKDEEQPPPASPNSKVRNPVPGAFPGMGEE